MTRPATHKDFPACLKLAHEAIGFSSYRGYKIDERETRKLFYAMIVSSQGYAAVIERNGEIRGFLLGMIDRMWFTRKDQYATDLITLAKPGTEHGFELVQDFVAWARKHPLRPKEVRLALSSGLVPSILLDRLYRQEGFEYTGGIFLHRFREDRPVQENEMSEYRQRRRA